MHAAADDTSHVQVHVSDGGLEPTTATSASWAADQPKDERGRGANIISVLADRAGTGCDTDRGSATWATLYAA